MSNTTKQFVVTWVALIVFFGWTSWHECEHGWPLTTRIGTAIDYIGVLEAQKSILTENEYDSKLSEIQRQMVLFSDVLADKLSISERDMVMCEADRIWSIGNYEVCVRGFPWNNWESMLILTPKGISGTEVGYSNTHIELPSSWHYLQKGTATEILPPLIIQSAIRDL